VPVRYLGLMKEVIEGLHEEMIRGQASRLAGGSTS
jgi:hypothetical protein